MILKKRQSGHILLHFIFKGCLAFCADFRSAIIFACAGFPLRGGAGKGQCENNRCGTEVRIRHARKFFPQSTQYEYAENVEFEVYSSADVSDSNYKCEIWIAVKEKTE